jgi:hypothetical protein
MPECPDCERSFRGPACPRCQWVAPAPAPRPARLCPVDGARLQADGFCPTGHGWPQGTPCPFACPLCRHPLGWDGGCLACFGCTTCRREDWTFPGHRYELEAHHWRRDDSLPPGRPACTPAETAAGLAQVRAILARGPRRP